MRLQTSTRAGAKAMSDTELLDALERDVRRFPLTLWDGPVTGFPGGPRGLHLGNRTLRQAIAQMVGWVPQTEIEHPTHGRGTRRKAKR